MFFVLTAVGIALGYRLWRFWWPTCFTSTCFSTTSLSCGCGAAWDGQAGSAILLLSYGTMVLACMWQVRRFVAQSVKERPTQ